VEKFLLLRKITTNLIRYVYIFGQILVLTNRLNDSNSLKRSFLILQFNLGGYRYGFENTLNYSLLFLLLLASFSCTKNPTEPENQQNNKIVFDRDNNVFLSNINIGSKDGQEQVKLTNTDPGWSGHPLPFFHP